MSSKQRNSRAARAAQEAAEAAAAERERKQATVIGVSVCAAVIAVIITVIAVVWAFNSKPQTGTDASGNTVTLSQARSEVAAVKTSPKHSNSNGGFLFSKNGIDKPVKDAPTLQIYMDFLCPACGNFDRQLFPSWNKMVAAGQMNLEIHPNGFLDASSTDDYSTRAASAAAYIADKDPDHTLAFIQDMYDESYQPQEGSAYKATPDSAIVAVAKKAGVKTDVAEQSVKGTYTKWIKAMSTYTPLRPELQHPDGANKGEMTTPTVLINNHYWDYETATQDGTGLPDAFLNALGLSASAIGQSGATPSIGSTKAPQA